MKTIQINFNMIVTFITDNTFSLTTRKQTLHISIFPGISPYLWYIYLKSQIQIMSLFAF